MLVLDGIERVELSREEEERSVYVQHERLEKGDVEVQRKTAVTNHLKNCVTYTVCHSVKGRGTRLARLT